MRFIYDMGAIMPADPEAASFLVQMPEGTELEVKVVKSQRTAKQNRALHGFLGDLANNLNDAGFDLLSFPWKEGVEIPWNLDLAKERLWVPIQQVVTGKKKTSDLDTNELDQVYQPLARKISGMGVQVPPLGIE